MLFNSCHSDEPKSCGGCKKENLKKENAEPSDGLSEGAHQVNKHQAPYNTHAHTNVDRGRREIQVVDFRKTWVALDLPLDHIQTSLDVVRNFSGHANVEHIFGSIFVAFCFAIINFACGPAVNIFLCSFWALLDTHC